jgi:hypothetical protein
MAVVAAYRLHTHSLYLEPGQKAQARPTRIIAQKHRQVCSQFKIHPEHGQFAMCSQELAIVRQQQSDRRGRGVSLTVTC